MENLNFTPIIIGLVALLLGWVIGFFDSNNRTSKKIKEAEQKAEAEINQAREEAKQAIQAAEAQALSVQTAAAPVANSLLILSLDQNSQPCLDLDGQRVDTSRLAPEQRKRLIDLMVVMRPWIEGSATQKPVAPRPLAANVPSLSKPIQPPAPQPTPPVAASVSQLLSTPITAAPAAPSKEVAGPTSMVGQIDAILQTRLAGTPLESRKIRLIESLQGGVVVMIDKDRFEAISDVPDPEILAAIRAAVAEWEKKYTPGA